MPLDEDTVRLARGKNLATVVTLMPDGQPQALLTWVDTDGEHLLVNTEPQRQRAKKDSGVIRFRVQGSVAVLEAIRLALPCHFLRLEKLRSRQTFRNDFSIFEG